MRVTISHPKTVTVEYRQDKDDSDYGSCMWARFYLDLDNYALTIQSDCGDYSYKWYPTPETESFIELMCRCDRGYLLDKLSDRTQIDMKATKDAVIMVIEDAADYHGHTISEDVMKQINYVFSGVCLSTDWKEVIDDVMDAIKYDELSDYVKYYDLCECIQTDYSANAKKIVEVFTTAIVPKLRKLI